MINLRLLRSTGRARRALLELFFLSIGAAAVLAQQPKANTDLPSVERLRAHISYLASDKLEGRRTGSAGAKLAAEYIAREFARYGLRRSNGYDTPGMSILEADSPRRYWQEFPYVAGVQLGQNNSMSIKSNGTSRTAVPLGADWMPLGFSTNGRIENASVVFVRYGITATELKYDDYAGVAAAGKVVVAFEGTPDGDNPHGQFARFEDTRFKSVAARDHGAIALVIMVHDENFKDDRLSRLRYDNTAGAATLPVAAISRKAAAQLMGGNISQLAEVEKWTATAGNTTLAMSKKDQDLKFLISVTGLENAQLSFSTDLVRREVPAANVVGILPGSDPKLKDEAIVIGAHFDHLGLGGEGSLAPHEGEIHHGADDNASGVAGMLELARIFSAREARPRRTLVFIAFSGEEEGLLGSNYYVNHPIVPLAQTVAMINMDMIGRLKDEKLIIGGVGTAAEWRAEIDAANLAHRNEAAERVIPGQMVNLSIAVPTGSIAGPAVSLDFSRFQLTLNEDGFGPSDHSSFYSKQIPVLFFWTGTHEDYHKPSDTAEKINYEGEARILSLVARIVRDIDKNDKRPSYAVAKTESTGRSMGFRVYLGTIPNYADSTNGLLLDGVRDDSPAAKAGLKAGDRIVKLAGREVKNVYDYTYALGEMKAGQEYEVEALRGAEKVSMKITPAARK